ncbi:ornithine cyclodeaminase family protein [Streptomyces specialis]|uniref:ornithine cyclodeaminase family protein n=1 Tax=Streptomyces specialis TaxID=498367 RepID=UPI00073E250B|nr:ornithine cyclodeaminase family protein [Streptomyces specialis]
MDTTAPRASTLALSSADVLELTAWKRTVDVLAEAYGGTITTEMVPPRTMARGDGVWLRGLTAVSTSGDVVGAKLITAATATGEVSYVITLQDRRTAELLAVIDGHHVTGLRTAATSALAADRLAVAGPVSVGVIGAGFEATNHVDALAAVRDIGALRVFSPTPANRERFAARARDRVTGRARAVDSPEAAVREADLVICAARSRDETPVIDGAWLRPGTTLVSIGSTLPEQREADTTTIARADLIVADVVEEVRDDSGDMIAARAAGIDIDARLVPLADLISGRVTGRSSPDQILVYKSVGSALQDIVLAEHLYREATERGIGRRLPALVTPVTK